MIGYHVTTPRKLERYLATRAILPPVRMWPTLRIARLWAARTGRAVILRVETDDRRTYPIHDHEFGKFTDEPVRRFAIAELSEERRNHGEQTWRQLVRKHIQNR